MKVLITGATGFLGKIILLNLSPKFDIFTLGRYSGDVKCDLSHNIPDFIFDFDLVIHSAGKAHFIPSSNADINSFYNVNVQGTKNLLKGLEFKVPQQFVFISSVSVYGKKNGFNFDEQEALIANDSYGLSKIQAEQLVKDWCQKNNVVCTILRLPLLIGKNAPGNFGTMVKGIKKGYYFNIGGGNAKKSMVLTEDVARFIPIIAPIGGTYNLTDGVHPSFADLSFAISKKNIKNLPLFFAKILGFIGDMLGENAPINSLKIKKITSDLTFDDSRARGMGWEPHSVLEYLKNNNF
jgi:nucleoside-diphosphate-sugar epimerase